MIDSSNPLHGVTKIYYISQWPHHPPNIHIRFNNSSNWTTMPMKKSKKGMNLYKIKFNNCFQTEYVFCNNDKTKWDKPSQYCDSAFKNQENNYYCQKDGVYVIFDHKVFKINSDVLRNKKKVDKETKLLLMSDLDGTLIGDDHALAFFNQVWIENFLLDKRYILSYCTGRGTYKFNELVHQKQILMPDYLICSTGCRLFDMRDQIKHDIFLPPVSFDDDNYQEYYENILHELEEYLDFKKLSKWDAETINSLIEQHEIRQYLENNPCDPSDRWTLRYQVKTTNLDKLHQCIDDFTLVLQSIGLEVKFIISGEGDYRYVDLFPKTLDKGLTGRFLSKHLKISEKSEIIGFGDSNNDVELLTHGVNHGYIVQNAQEELVSWFQSNKDKYPHIEISPFKHAYAHIHYLSRFFQE